MPNPATHRQQQKKNTRRLILETAYKLFAEVGYERATMRELAQRAGVGVGTVFKHFPDKPSLLVAAYLEDMSQVIRDAFASMSEKGIRDQLLHITSRLYAFYAENLVFSRTLFKESLFLGGEHGAAMDEQLYGFLDAIAGLVRKAIEEEDLPVETHPLLTAQIYGSFYLGALVMGLKSPSFEVKAQVRLVRDMLDIWYAGAGGS
jgi:AcrR family transcriptional regulator